MDPPIPPNVTETLDVAESDLTLLTFKYAILSTAAAKRPPSSTVGETNEGGDNAGGTEDENVAGGLCEEDLSGLLDEHVSFEWGPMHLHFVNCTVGHLPNRTMKLQPINRSKM